MMFFIIETVSTTTVMNSCQCDFSNIMIFLWIYCPSYLTLPLPQSLPQWFVQDWHRYLLFCHTICSYHYTCSSCHFLLILVFLLLSQLTIYIDNSTSWFSILSQDYILINAILIVFYVILNLFIWPFPSLPPLFPSLKLYTLELFSASQTISYKIL